MNLQMHVATIKKNKFKFAHISHEIPGVNRCS